MEKFLLKDIEEQAKEIRDKYNNYHNYLHLAILRLQRNYINPRNKIIKIPDEWKKDKKYNPFYVLKRKKQIAKSVSKNILKGSYIPNKPIIKKYLNQMEGNEKSVYIRFKIQLFQIDFIIIY